MLLDNRCAPNLISGLFLRIGAQFVSLGFSVSVGGGGDLGQSGESGASCESSLRRGSHQSAGKPHTISHSREASSIEVLIS